METHIDSLRTADEMADYLRCSKATLYRMCREGMPFYQLTHGGDRRFDPAAVLEWMDSHTVGAET